MGPRALAACQWKDYARYHRSVQNLLVHVVAVPPLLLGNLLAVAGLAFLSWGMGLGGLALSAIAFAAQGLGHKAEAEPPGPSWGPGLTLIYKACSREA